ncbi:MAG: cupin domain-containing protein [Nanoarchaeota archaeon]
MKIKRLEPECNLDTVRDGRGGIFTYYPKDPIVEFNYMFIKSQKIRGNHYHPEFDEYFILTSGSGIVVTKDSTDTKEEFLYLSKGQCICTPKNTRHVFYAITDCTAVALLTKKWNDCNKPIVHENLGMGRGDHGDPTYEGVK